MSTVLMDFGASRIKSARFDRERGLWDLREARSCPPRVIGNGRFEVSPEDLKECFHTRLREHRQSGPVERILICSEMHGFILLDTANRPLSPYISWKDERDQNAGGTVRKALEKCMSPAQFRVRTGMRLRPSLPVLNACHVLRDCGEPAAKLCSLPEWLAAAFGCGTEISHLTMSAGLGIFAPDTGEPVAELLDFMQEQSGKKIRLNRVVQTMEVAGYVEGIPILCGVGDLQCAILGAGNNDSTLSLNLGTGSQVSMIGNRSASPELEVRPYFDGQQLKTITHIPSGRVLSRCIGFLNEASGGAVDYWKRLAEISTDAIRRADWEMDLALFPSAWRYRGTAGVRGLTEENLTVEACLASLLKAYAKQYLDAIGLFAPLAPGTEIRLSGGIAERLKNLCEYLAQELLWTVTPPSRRDSTLDGLVMLANRMEE